MVIRPEIKRKLLKGKIKYEYNPFTNLRSEEGELKDFITQKLQFDLEHPVDIEC
mgnify:CR=1 FL=1